MKELARRILPTRKENRLPEKVVNESEQLFGDILDGITKQGKELLRGKERKKLAGTETTVYEPGLTETGELKNLRTPHITITDGATLEWEGLPAAVIYGHLKDDDKVYLSGGVHYPEAVTRNNIDLKRADGGMTALTPEFPGHFLRDTDSLAFCMAYTTDGSTVGLIVGDQDPKNRVLKSIPVADLQNSKTKKATIDGITDLIKQEIRKKYYGETTA